MPFEQVEKAGRGGSATEPLISLRKSAGIGLNSVTMEEHFEDADYVQVFYDEANEKLGLKPAEEDDENVFKINRTASSGGVTPTNFLNTYGLVPEVTTRYRVEYDEDEDLVVADLTESAGTYGDENTGSIDE